MTHTIRVLVVDDSAFFRNVLRTEIMKQPGFEIVGIAADGRTAIEKMRELNPDVITLDIEMPVMSGLEALRTITAESTAGVIMVSAQTESGAKATIQALELGATDFIPKTRGPTFIHEKLRTAADARRSRLRSRSIARRAKADDARGPSSSAPTATVMRKDAKLVVIGSSTGGPQALMTLLRALPRNFPLPIVVAQHMPPHFTEALARRLDDNCQIRVVHANDGDKLVPGTTYIAPGGCMIRVKPGELCVTFQEQGHLYKPSVEVLAQSAIAAYGKHVIGVLLTGMGSDGAKALHNLHQLGGYTLAQDQATCVVYGMPKALVDAGGASEVLALDDIGSRLGTLLGGGNSPAASVVNLQSAARDARGP